MSPFLESPLPTSLLVGWKRPLNPNGEVIQFKISYQFNIQKCRGEGESRTKHTILNVTDTWTENNNISYTIEPVYPAWNYTVWIQARTSKGFGKASAEKHLKTIESSMYNLHIYDEEKAKNVPFIFLA